MHHVRQEDLPHVGKAGDLFVIKAGEIHGFRAIGDANLVQVDVHMSPTFIQGADGVASVIRRARHPDEPPPRSSGIWGIDEVTLLGDAAHPVLPHTGQGAAQAMVDAVTLAKTLGDGGDVERALRAYEDDRRGKTAALLKQGRRTARVMKTTTLSPVIFAK